MLLVLQTSAGEKSSWIRIIFVYIFSKMPFGNGNCLKSILQRGYHFIGFKIFSSNCIFTAKWMWDRSIFSSKFPMHDNNDLRVCKICKCKCEHEIVFVTKIQTKQFQVCTCVCKSYKTRK